ncbi:hypothetical protein AK830_g11768 [Neonectria ditissima]|uniref:Zn(2)-C6 fungal-type domain-containing protein n=1 Tax=Neonectria ditissima TaxID=78410 RepID=A0A0P7B1X7_9HYPO|nr:hypothetical protein AK830_g11768 [Neonectria ditissima]
MSATSQPPGPASSGSDSGLKIWSCVICRRRKVKCDRRDPCSNCVKAGIDCHFPVTGRISRRNRDTSAWRSPAQKQSELLGRLRRLEAVVTELTAQVEDGPGDPGEETAPGRPLANPSVSATGSISSPNTTRSEARSTGQSLDGSSSDAPSVRPPAGSEFDEEFGRLVVDKDGGLHVGNRFWSVFCDEVDNILQAVHDVADYSEPNASAVPELGSGVALGPQGFVFGNNGGPGSLDALNPLPSQMLFIWQTFVENVDPFIKVLHVPTMDKIVRELRGNFSTLGPNMEPLLFAISLAAITSMEDQEVMTNFNAPKSHLLAHYRLGTEQALGQAQFLVTKEIVVVQAFVIYLSILPYLGANELTWPLTGLLLRIAKSMGLHRNDNSRHKAELENELRRRLWWQICFLDSKMQKPGAQDLSISEKSFDTDLPSTADDSQMDSSTSKPVVSSTNSPNMMPCLVRCEIWRFVQAIQANSTNPPQVRLQLFRASRLRIENSYLRGLRQDFALDNFIKTMASLFFAKAELVIHRSCQSQTAQTPNPPDGQYPVFSVLRASITIINAAYALITEPAWQKWRWQLVGHAPWHAIGIFLHQVCRMPWGPESEQVWITTKRIIEGASEDSKKNKLWLPLLELAKQAEKHRATEMERQTAETLGAETLANLASHEWGGKITDGSTGTLSYPTNELNQMAIEPQASDPGYEPTLGNPELLTAEGLPHPTLPSEGLLDASTSGYQSDPINQPMWSPSLGIETSGQAEPPSFMPLDDGCLMDWDGWDDISAMEGVWDLF